MDLTVLIENLVYSQDLKGEHGLSFYIKTDDGINILFDTGQTGDFVFNARKLGVDLKTIDYVVLSHGHYDHTGGLEAFLEINNTAKIIMKLNALAIKYSDKTGKIRKISFPLRENYKNFPNEFLFIKNDYEIGKHVKIISKIKITNTIENKEEHLFYEKAGKVLKDNFRDELFMTLEKEEEFSIINGCAHNGIINIINQGKEKVDKKLKYIIGGTHLKSKSKEILDFTINELKEMDFEKIYVNHCTGIDSYAEMKLHLKDKVDYLFTGNKVEF